MMCGRFAVVGTLFLTLLPCICLADLPISDRPEALLELYRTKGDSLTLDVPANGKARLDIELLPIQTSNALLLPQQQQQQQLEDPTPSIIQPSRHLTQTGQCARIAQEINRYTSIGWRMTLKRFKIPDRCPLRCRNSYRGPPTGKMRLTCNPQTCFCTAAVAGTVVARNIVLKDSGALSIVDALPGDCPRQECIGGGYSFCQNC